MYLSYNERALRLVTALFRVGKKRISLLTRLTLCRWFHAVKKDMAVQRLQMRRGNAFQHPDGAFLVRPSESNADDLSLSVRYVML